MPSRSELIALAVNTGFVPDPGSFDADKTFAQNGIDSLDTMTVLLAIEEAVGAKFSESELAAIHSLADVERTLAQRAA